MNKEPTPSLAVVVPMPSGRLLDVPTIPQLVFDEWRRVTGRGQSRCFLTDTRRRMIQARVREGYELEDLLDAVRGLTRSAWHMGANPDGKVWSELKYAMRSGEDVEKMRDLYRSAPSQQATSSADPAVAAIQRQREREGRG